MLSDIPGYSSFVSIGPVAGDKGLSGDKKYLVETAGGQRLLLRVSGRAAYDRKKAEYEMMARVYRLGVLTPRPLGFGRCGGGQNVYSLAEWIEGEDAEKALPLMSETEQYAWGRKAGETLRKIHTLPAPGNARPWGERFRRKVRQRLDYIFTAAEKNTGADKIMAYLNENQHWLDGRPQTFNHGDFNISNLLVTPGGRIGVIDFNHYHEGHGDPWREFSAFIWGAEPWSHFYTGMIKGYFDDGAPAAPPPSFFRLLSYYLAYDALAAFCDTRSGEQGTPEEGKRHLENVLHWFNDMAHPVPSWYLADYYIQWLDGIPFTLKPPGRAAAPDFSFLRKYGKVFKIFDAQDSGNICFGVADGENRYFIKLAGTPTARAVISAEKAVENLRRTVPVYQDLAHPVLVKFLCAEEIDGGFAMVFEWADAECMHPMYPRSRKKFLQMPLETKRRVFEDILAFHAHAAQKGYVAIDFYEASILYDFNRQKTVICDIDFYAPLPYTNHMGRMWGSARFMSPEEFQLGAVLDEVTNVYTMGAVAFALFGDSREKSFDQWQLSKELYAVAQKAVSPERGRRQPSIERLLTEWKDAQYE